MVSPSAARIASSPSRRTDRARIRLATFEQAMMKTSAEAVDAPPPVPEERGTEAFESAGRHRLAVIEAQRSALLDARDDGTFDADVLESVLAALDSSQIDIELRRRTAR